MNDLKGYLAEIIYFLCVNKTKEKPYIGIVGNNGIF